MALKQPLAIKYDIGTADLELTAGPGESFLVKDILTHNCAESYITVRIDKTTVGYFRVGGVCGAHIFRLANWNRHSHGITVDIDAPGATDGPYRVINAAGDRIKLGMHAEAGAPVAGKYRFNEAVQNVTGGRAETLLQYLVRMGLWTGFPVAEGETITITGVWEALRVAARQLLIYEIHEAGDMTPQTPNGSKSLSYTFLNYGNCGATISSATDTLYTTSLSPAEFPAFPFGAVVPAKTEIEILGVCGSAFAPAENRTLHYIYTRFLKFVKDREVLFDEDRNGILFENNNRDLTGRRDSIAQGFSLIGNKSEYDLNDPFMFNPPLKFVSGDELGIYLTTAGLGTCPDLVVDKQEIALIERVTRLA